MDQKKITNSDMCILMQIFYPYFTPVLKGD